ncbi:Hypothetical predicted protein [Paramuricea clavata]|uniref:Uncharacterized protein n=1 Tax=Paramuricea clavata TaxID=317549 RepID=A0A6S7HTF3_PARCT|nr:Hypothetical predicted protein [Paramuricea clavata]
MGALIPIAISIAGIITTVVVAGTKTITGAANGLGAAGKALEKFAKAALPILKGTIKVRRFFDEEARDKPIADPEKKFRVEVFLFIDTATSQLEERFKGQTFVYCG